MAIILRWKVPNDIVTDTAFDKVYIYRATSETGSYTEITDQTISDNTYSDEAGSTTSWYKIRFYDSNTSNYSDYSDPMQGGTFIGYCSIQNFRAITNLDTSCINDSDAYDLIAMAAYQINGDVNTKVFRERVEYIDSTRTNYIDGSNTDFYIKNFKGKYLADLNNDSEVNTNDVIVYAVDSNGTESVLTVDSVDVDDCKITLSEAPTSDKTLYITYAWSYVDESLPDNQLRMACAFLTAALAQAKINIGRAPQMNLGNMRIYRDMDSYDAYYSKYLNIIRQINNRMIDTVDVSGMKG